MKTKELPISVFLFFITILLSPTETVKAQSEFGVKGGILYSGINRKYNGLVFDFEMKSSPIFGVFYKQNNILGPVSFQAELLYQIKGGNVYIENFCPTHCDGKGGGYSYGIGYYDKMQVPWMRRPQKYHYLSVPLILSYSPIKLFDVYAGTEIGYMISHSKYSLEHHPNRFAAGLVAGVGINLGKDTKFDIRYSGDITRVADFGDTDLKNYGFSFTVQQTLFRKQ